MRILTAALLAAIALAGPATAQTAITRADKAVSGKVARLAVAPNLKRDCAVGPVPEVKIVGAPRNGQVEVRTAKQKTPAGYRCPNVEAQVRGVFYKSKDRFTGEDEVSFELKDADGTVRRYTVKITVSAAGAPDAKKDATDL